MSTDKNEKDTAAQAENAEEIKDTPAEETKAEAETEKPADEDKGDKKNAKKSKKDEKSEKSEKSESKKEPEKKEDPAMAALNDKYLRLCAEYDNFRRRSQKEKDNLYGDVKADTLLKFLPVYDNLVRALNTPTEDEAFRKGVEMTMNQFNTTIEKLGVTRIDSLGEKFDPALHNAVMHVEDESKGENEIVEVFQEGFKLGDKVIRFAMVKVAN
jgi:molecular chaperone GrpE